METTTRRAAIYARISQDRDGTMLGVERQRADCVRLAERNGWEVAGLYVDNDLSAFNGKARPEYARLLADMRAGAIDAVVAWHPDRLHRSPRELEAFIDVVEARGIAVETASAGTLDLSTPSGRAVARTLGAWARYESEHKAERQRRKHVEIAERGEPLRGGSRPFGLSADWSTVIPDEAALVREAVERVLAGDSLRGIATDWNARGILTTTGGRWQQHPLRRMLTSGRLAGLREHHGRTITGTWPAIVDVPTLERLRAILRDPERRTTTARARHYLLTGFLVCGVCDARLVARPRADKVRRYICAKGPMYAGCGRTYILAEPAEDLIEAMVVDAIDSPALTSALRDAPDSDTRALLEGLRRDQDGLAELARDHYAERVIGRAEYLAARDALEHRMEATRRKLAADARGGALAAVAGDAAARWPSLSFDQRRAIIGAVVERIVVGAGRRGYNRFDPSRIDPHWRV